MRKVYQRERTYFLCVSLLIKKFLFPTNVSNQVNSVQFVKRNVTQETKKFNKFFRTKWKRKFCESNWKRNCDVNQSRQFFWIIADFYQGFFNQFLFLWLLLLFTRSGERSNLNKVKIFEQSEKKEKKKTELERRVFQMNVEQLKKRTNWTRNSIEI